MKITSIEALPLAVPFASSDPPSARLSSLSTQVLIRVRSDDGVIGWGECFAYGAASAVVSVVDDVIAPMLTGETMDSIERLTGRVEKAMLLYGRRGIAVHALSGVEISLWDLLARSKGVPLYNLLGGLAQPAVTTYASLPRYAGAAEVAQACAQALEAGYSAVKLHQSDVDSVRVAREVLGPDVKTMLDVNCIWTPEESIRMAHAFEPYNLAWLEEPVWPPEDYDGLSRVAATTATPIACGENESLLSGFKDIVAHKAASVLQPSVTKVGGLLHAQRVCALAAEAGVSVSPHCFYFGPGLAATLHLVAATTNCLYLEMPFTGLEASILAGAPAPTRGLVPVPNRPGLGFDPDEAVLKRYAL